MSDQINALKPHALVPNGENGYQLEDISTTSTPNWISSTILPSPGDGKNNISFKTGEYVTIIGHNHPSDAGPVPSWQDINVLRKLYVTASLPYNESLVVSYLVVKNPDPSGSPATLTYAMVVDNITILNQWLEQDLSKAPTHLTPEAKAVWVQNNIDNVYYSTTPGGATMQKFFFKQYSAGFSVYELKPTGVWNKLTYNNASETITATPCPENN